MHAIFKEWPRGVGSGTCSQNVFMRGDRWGTSLSKSPLGLNSQKVIRLDLDEELVVTRFKQLYQDWVETGGYRYNFGLFCWCRVPGVVKEGGSSGVSGQSLHHAPLCPLEPRLLLCRAWNLLGHALNAFITTGESQVVAESRGSSCQWSC
jgi:hypothetical protein